VVSSQLSEHDGLKPTEKARGIAGVEARLSDIFGHNRARANYHVIANGNRQDSGIRADTNIVTNASCLPSLSLRRRTAIREKVVDKHGSMGDKAIVTNRDKLTNERVGLNSATLTNRRSLLDFNEWTDEAAISNCAAVEIDRLHNGYILTKCDVDYSRLSYLRLRHKVRNDRLHSIAIAHQQIPS